MSWAEPHLNPGRLTARVRPLPPGNCSDISSLQPGAGCSPEPLQPREPLCAGPHRLSATGCWVGTYLLPSSNTQSWRLERQLINRLSMSMTLACTVTSIFLNHSHPFSCLKEILYISCIFLIRNGNSINHFFGRQPSCVAMDHISCGVPQLLPASLCHGDC